MVKSEVLTTAMRLAVVTPVISRMASAATAPAICAMPRTNRKCSQRFSHNVRGLPGISAIFISRWRSGEFTVDPYYESSQSRAAR